MALVAGEVEDLLADAEVVPVLEAPVADAKRLLERCLEADIPVVLGRDDHCTKGCSPKLILFARQEDAPRVGQLLNDAWRASVMAEGTVGGARATADVNPESDDLPCPACGFVVPASAAECPDCGLVV